MNKNLFKCWCCQKEISKQAKMCPHCGRDYSEKELKQVKGGLSLFRKIIYLVLIYFFIKVFATLGMKINSIDLDSSNYKEDQNKTYTAKDIDIELNKISNVKAVKAEKEVKNWDEGRSEYEKEQFLKSLFNKLDVAPMTINQIEKLSLECKIKIMGEAVIDEDIYFSKGREGCIKFMDNFYPQTLLDNKNECLNYEWNDYTEKTTQYKKYCKHFYNTYFREETEYLNDKINNFN